MFAAIDVGTNTVRLLIGGARNGEVAPHIYQRRITRLGGGFSVKKGLAPEAMERTLFALQEFAILIKQYPIRGIRAVGTEALRVACNGDLFVRRVVEQTGIPLEIIKGRDEAALSALGVMSALSPKPPKALIFDIGGGSTEFILVDGSQLLFNRSYPLGVVRLTEKFGGDEVGQSAAISNVLTQLDTDLRRLCPASADFPLIGTAGTVTTLAALQMGMEEYDWRRINNFRMTISDIRCLYDKLLPLSIKGREGLPGMEQGRGDLIVPGVRIVLELLKLRSANALIVSDFGLLEGVLLDLHACADRPT